VPIRRSIPLISAALGLALGLVGCAGRGGGENEGPYVDDFPKTYNDVELKRIDLRPIGKRQRMAMGTAPGKGVPDGGISTVISLDQRTYRTDDPIYMTVLWVNNSERPIRVSRRLFLEANFRPLVFLNDEVQVLYNVATLPPAPTKTLRPADFWIIPPFGEKSQVVDLKDVPRYGASVGMKVRWAYNVDRPGMYKIRVGIRSVPYQLVPEVMRGDPTADAWEGSTLSNVVEFEVKRR
jgi:hypothetical protein